MSSDSSYEELREQAFGKGYQNYMNYDSDNDRYDDDRIGRYEAESDDDDDSDGYRPTFNYNYPHIDQLYTQFNKLEIKKKCKLCEKEGHEIDTCPDKCPYCQQSTHKKEICMERPCEPKDIDEVVCIDCMKKGHISCKPLEDQSITWGTEPKDLSYAKEKPKDNPKIYTNPKRDIGILLHSSMDKYMSVEKNDKIKSIFGVDSKNKFCYKCGDTSVECKCKTN